MAEQIIVLGWDGLDLELAERFGVADQFGAHQSTIKTYVNPVTGEPHTKELWPSMITGLHPDEHGIRATVDGKSRPDWESAGLNLAATVADHTIPQSVQTRIGQMLQQRGTAQASKRPPYYNNQGIQTVLDATGARAISIPNFETAADRRLGLDANRDGVWSELADRGRETEFTPRVDMEQVHDILGREAGRRLGLTIQSLSNGNGLVWTWFGLLDTVGHIAPAVDAPLERQYYEVAAAQTAAVRRLVPDDATVIAVSDHGIQDGEHTHHATVCSDAAAPVAEINHVFEVADWLRGRDEHSPNHGTNIDGEELAAVNERLQALGYVQ